MKKLKIIQNPIVFFKSNKEDSHNEPIFVSPKEYDDELFINKDKILKKFFDLGNDIAAEPKLYIFYPSSC
tara:strand:+ start:532 stop:741 length:210 start_codon:yes stop_codon:yes gene_type:complete